MGSQTRQGRGGEEEAFPSVGQVFCVTWEEASERQLTFLANNSSRMTLMEELPPRGLVRRGAGGCRWLVGEPWNHHPHLLRKACTKGLTAQPEGEAWNLREALIS